MSVTKAASGVGSPQGNSLSPSQTPGEGLEKTQLSSGCPRCCAWAGTRSSPACSSALPTQDAAPDQQLLLSKLPPTSGKRSRSQIEPYTSCLTVFVPPCHHQSGWHLHMTALIFLTVLQEAWQGHGCLLGTIKAYLSVYLVAEALCTESKSQG